MHSIKSLKDKIFEIEKKIEISFSNQELLVSAFVHPSFINENRSPPLQSYERLEFLGDSVLNLLVSQWLYSFFQSAPEGELSWMRACLVDAKSCATYLEMIGLEAYILTSKGEKQNQGKGRLTIFSDVFEALLGALYIDSGMEGAQAFFQKKIRGVLEEKVKNLSKNPKMVLQSYLQKLDQSIPQYLVVMEEGPEHEKKFMVRVSHGDCVLGEGSGFSKKDAQMEAAKQALIKLGL